MYPSAHPWATASLHGQMSSDESPAFASVLFDGPSPEFSHAGDVVMRACFVDLNLDQVVDGVTATHAEHQLKPIFYTPLSDAAAVQYRQEVAKDLDGTPLRAALEIFAGQLRKMLFTPRALSRPPRPTENDEVGR